MTTTMVEIGQRFFRLRKLIINSRRVQEEIERLSAQIAATTGETAAEIVEVVTKELAAEAQAAQQRQKPKVEQPQAPTPPQAPAAKAPAENTPPEAVETGVGARLMALVTDDPQIGYGALALHLYAVDNETNRQKVRSLAQALKQKGLRRKGTQWEVTT